MQQFIYKIINNIFNGSNPKRRINDGGGIEISIEEKKCRGETSRTNKQPSIISWASIWMSRCRRHIQTLRSIRFKGEQYPSSPRNIYQEAKQKVQEIIVIPFLFIFLNPNLVTIIANIEASFTDEFIYINMIQLSHIITDISILCGGCI